MNRKLLLVVVCAFLLFVSGINVEAKSLVAVRNNSLENIDIEESLIQDETEYYLYFYKTACPYCIQVSEAIETLSTRHKVYALNCDIVKNRGQQYDWSKSIHSAKEIGYIDEEGNTIFYPGESAEKYLLANTYDQYGNKQRYEMYSSIPDGQDIEMIYVKMMTPEINYAIVNSWQEIVIAGVPTLLHVTNGHIDEFFFDSVEIKDILDE